MNIIKGRGLFGRPLKFTDDELIEKLENYLGRCIEFRDDGMIKILSMPKRSGFALSVPTSKDMITEWEDYESFPKFSRAIKVLDTIQEDFLYDSMASSPNTPIWQIFLLKTNHGYIETQANKNDITTNGKDLPSVLNVNVTDYSKGK